MENASKALLITGGVLIGILVLSLAIVLYTTFRESATVTQKKIDEERTMQFNSQFTIYDKKTDLDIYDIIKIASTANENNQKYGVSIAQNGSENSLYVQVKVKFSNTVKYNNSEQSVNEKETWLKNYSNQKYTCNVKISNITGRVYFVEINPT